MAIEIWGGQCIDGESVVQGSKNAALPLVAAALLCEGQTHFYHCPKIRDVEVMLSLVRELGGSVSTEGHHVLIDAHAFDKMSICGDLVKELRASVLFMGACLAKFGEVAITYPGGCSIGKRPIDFHIQAFEKMGAEIKQEDDKIVCRCKKILHGAKIRLPFPSVGATENVILAASLAHGETTITNAACEPEVVELCHFLQAAGALIYGEGTKNIRIVGRRKLNGIPWTVCGDRIVFFTFAMLVAGCGGRLMLNTKDLFGRKEREIWHRLGGEETKEKNRVLLEKKRPGKAVSYVATGPYPAFPTDDQSLLLPVLAKASGVSTIEEKVFENRFRLVGQLHKMGANIDFVGNRARVIGVTKLHGANVTAWDLRSGAGLVVAAAMAEGKTKIEQEHLIDRGYENLVGQMNAIGICAKKSL